MIAAPMPPGVEHKAAAPAAPAAVVVIAAPMPPGVEHLEPGFSALNPYRCDRRPDAPGR